MAYNNAFSTSIEHINSSTRKRGILVRRLFRLLDGKSNYILSFISLFITIIPLPVPPGFSTIIALPALFITFQIAYGKQQVWIPNRIANARISKKKIRMINNISKKYITFIEKLTKQRFSIFVSPKIHRFYDIILFAFAILSAVPIPILCMVPAIGGILLSAGIVFKDGLLTIISLIIGFFGASLIWFAIKALFIAKNYLPL